MAGVFISYRREDSRADAGRLYDELSRRFGKQNVFMDIDTVEPGLDWVEVIERTVESCDVIVALIGPRWLTVKNRAGRRRIDDPKDPVLMELSIGLSRGTRIIPTLVGVRDPAGRIRSAR